MLPSISQNIPHGMVAGTRLILLVAICVSPTLAQPTELFFSEYVEGSSNSKAIEIYNPGSTVVDLAAAGYVLEVYFNGQTEPETVIALTGIVPGQDVFVVADEDAAMTILLEADQVNGSPFWNGNDALLLLRGTAVVDSFGQIGDDPGDAWTGGGISTRNRTLRRRGSVCTGDLDPTDPFDPSVEWNGFSQDTFGGLGRHDADCDVVDPPTSGLEIFDVQGSGATSPFEGQEVTLSDNVVTATGPEGFFIQTPISRDDDDIDTSNGLFVFTGGAPTVAVGDLVEVTAEVTEFFGLTELTDPEVTVVGTAPLPPAVVFNGGRPSPDPNSPGCALEPECYEGMRIEVPAGTVSGANLSFGSDPVAEVAVVAAPERTFRGKGVEFPGPPNLPPGVPVWDGNPEIFELDPDKLGLANRTFSAGSSFRASGVLGFEFGDYELWPTVLVVTEEFALPRPVRRPMDDELTIGSLNLFRLFDDVDDPGVSDDDVERAEYDRRLAKLSLYIRQVLRAPDVLAVQEVEKLEVLEDLAARIQADAPATAYSAHLLEGHDVGGIDVGFLIRPETVRADAVMQLGASEIFQFPGRADSFLHDRPPLLLEATFLDGDDEIPFAVLNNHTRSLNGIDDPDGRVRQKRLEQAQSIAGEAQNLQTARPTRPLVVLGDLNAFEFTDGYVDVVGQIRGVANPLENILSGPDLVSPNLELEVLRLPRQERYSFVFEGNAQVLDHALTSKAAAEIVTGFQYGRGNADAARNIANDITTSLRSSDHDGFVLYLDPDNEGGGGGGGGGEEGCVADDRTLCLAGDRFEVTVTWRGFTGDSGTARVVPVGVGSEDSGLFWFFDADNWEMLVKVLDGCSINDRFWVFAAATTDVEYTLRVCDTGADTCKEYRNPLGTASPAITDTDAFATCP